MINDFYCNEVLSGNVEIEKVWETENVLAYHHTRPSYKVHIVVIPKKHISSLLTITEDDHELLLELLLVVKKIANDIVSENGACKIITNLGEYQDSKHLHWHLIYGGKI
jgi:histidine triad (HIT) family protein